MVNVEPGVFDICSIIERNIEKANAQRKEHRGTGWAPITSGHVILCKDGEPIPFVEREHPNADSKYIVLTKEESEDPKTFEWLKKFDPVDE